MKPMRKKTAMTLALAALVGAPALQATAPAAAPAAPAAADDLSLADLLNIKLQTGSFLELDLAKSPLSMTVIDRTKINTSGARHLTELLEVYVPGFQYMYNKWNGMIWGMRGVANDRNSKFIVLVNGHKMNTEARDGYFQETNMGLFGDVERVEVLRGPAGLVYGSGAIAGIVNIVTRKAEKTGAEVQAQANTWANMDHTSQSIQGTVFGKMSDDQSVTATAGFEKSDGVGNGIARIYGKAHWPYPNWVPAAQSPKSVPSDGSAQATPGNWKAAADFNIKGVRVYARATHSVQEAGGLFIKDPWPAYGGNPSDIAKGIKEAQDSITAISNRVADSTTAADVSSLANYSAKLAALQANQNAPSALIDGKRIANDDPFWSQVETWNTDRREYVADNYAVEATYDLPMQGENLLKFKLGFDGNTDRIQRQMRPGYESNATGDERNSFLEETFGERRYTLGATYLMKNISKLQLAAGMEQRFDDIGDDMSGRNAQGEKATHKIVQDILYTNTALFTEGWYDLTPKVGIDFGLRWDGHTRTIDQGGTVNGKLASVFSAAPGHTVKLIFQSSSNNGSADNYEYNRNNFNDKGVAYSAAHFEKPFQTPSPTTDVLPGVTEDDLHSLKPEKVYSFELTSNHDLGRGISVSPSLSYNMVRDLFAWSQDLFRVVNVGQYDHFDVDLQADYSSKYVDLGANHAMQSVVNTDVADQAKSFTTGDYDKSGSSWYVKNADGSYTPVSNKTKSSTVNPVKDQITADGSNFLSLATHVSKLWINVKPLKWLTVHNDMRAFWGLAGRDSLYSADQKLGYDYLAISADPMLKWNASIHADLPSDWSVGLYAYDILGTATGDNAIHSIRWQQMGGSDQRELYAMDLRSFGIGVKKSF